MPTELRKPIATGKEATSFNLLEFTFKSFPAPTEEEPDARLIIMGATVELLDAGGGKLQRKLVVLDGGDPIWETLDYTALEDTILAAIKSQLEVT